MNFPLTAKRSRKMSAVNDKWMMIPQCRVFQCKDPDDIYLVQKEANDFAVKLSGKYQVTDILPCMAGSSNGFTFTITVVYELFNQVEDTTL